MMQNSLIVNRPAPLKNVAAFSTLLNRVVERRPDLPGMACFHGPSGYGKTKSAVFGANKYRAAYVECGQFTTAKSLLSMILKEMGVSQPRGTVTDLIEEAVLAMSSSPNRPLIVDEAHWVADKKFVDVLRELHDKSTAPVILIGEEILPRKLASFERVYNRILVEVAAVALDEEDFGHLARTSCPGIEIAVDLRDAILTKTGGNTRRVVVNLSKVEEVAHKNNLKIVSLDAFSTEATIVGTSAPMPRIRGRS